MRGELSSNFCNGGGGGGGGGGEGGGSDGDGGGGGGGDGASRIGVDRLACKLKEKLWRYKLAVIPMDKPITKRSK